MEAILEKRLKLDKSEWQKVKLGDVAFEYSKRINNPSESKFNRFVGSSNIGQWDFRVQSWESTDSVTSAMKLFEPNDYLLVRRSLYASDFRERAPRAHFSGVCSGDILTIKENSEMIVDGFLIGILNSPPLWKFVVANASGSITRRIKWNDLANYEFLLPPKEEQAELTKLLWAMDEVVEKERSLLYRNAVLRKSYLEKFQKPKKDWQRFKIIDLMELHYGKALKESERKGGDFPVVSSAGIQGTHNEYLIEGPGIVIGRKGNVGQVTWVDNHFWVIDTAYYVTINEPFAPLPLKFFYYLLISTNFQKFSIATAVPGLNRDDALLSNVYLPKFEEIKTLTAKLEGIDFLSLELEIKLQKSKSLLKSLINQIF